MIRILWTFQVPVLHLIKAYNVFNIIQNGPKFPGSRPWEADFEWEAPETDSYLAGHMSGLSFNESEDDDEDFLFLT